MELGDAVISGGRRFYVRDIDPAGVVPRYVYLEDAATGIDARAPSGRSGRRRQEGEGVLRLVDDDSRHQD
jgi:hypothetical protein